MPTILTHAALPLIAAWGLGPKRVSPRLAMTGAVVAVLPDLDVIVRLFGISADSPLGHRGISHSLAAALLLAVAGSWLLGPRPPWRSSLPFLFPAGLSHGLTDMLTDGGKGIALFWPVSDARLFAPFRPVEVSPILLRGIESGKLPIVLASEAIWVLLPICTLALLFRWVVAPHIDLPRGQS